MGELSFKRRRKTAAKTSATASVAASSNATSRAASAAATARADTLGPRYGARPAYDLETVADDSLYDEHEQLPGPQREGPEEDFTEHLLRSPTGGDPLEPALRERLERRFGRDLSSIRVHTGRDASRAAGALSSVAFTRGQHIFLGAPQHQTDTRLLSHELAHAVQQGAPPPLRLAAAPVADGTPVPRGAAPAPAPAAAAAGPAPAVQRREVDPWGAIRSVGGMVASGVRTGVGIVREGAEGLLDLGREELIRLARRIAPGLVNLFQGGGISRFVRNLIARGVSALINGVLVPLRSAFDFGSLAEQFGQATTALSEAGSTFQQNICDGVLGAARRISAFFSETFSPVTDWFRDMADSVSNAFSGLWEVLGAPVIDWLREAGGELWQSLQGFVSDIGGLIRDARAALGEGWDTVKGWLGIEAEDGESEGGGLWNWVQEKFSEIGGAITDAIRPVLGPMRSVAGVALLIVPGGQLVGVILLWPRIREAFNWLREQWQDLNLIPRAREFWTTTLLPRLMDGAERIGIALVEAADWAVGLLGRIGEALARALSSRLQGVLEPINALVDFAHAEFTRVINWGRRSLRGAARSMRQILLRLIELGRTILNGLLRLILMVVNPGLIIPFLIGNLWQLIPNCLKGPFIDFIIDILQRVVRAIPSTPLVGLLWPFIRSAVLGFLDRVKRFELPRKVNVSNKLAGIYAGESTSFFLGYLLGLAKGVWDAVTGPFQALIALFGLPQQIREFLSGLGVRMCELTEQISCFAASIASTVFGSFDSFMETLGSVFRNPRMILDTIRCALQTALQATSDLGGRLAERMMSLFEGPDERIGEELGKVTSSILLDAVITYFTAGAGAVAGVVRQIAQALSRVGRAVRQILGVIRQLFGRLIGFIRGIASRFASAAASGARGILGRIGGIFRRVGRWFGRLLRRVGRFVRRRFGLSPGQQARWLAFRGAVTSLVTGYPEGISRRNLQSRYRNIVRRFSRVAKRPAFILRRRADWRIYVRKVKRLRPRRVGDVKLDSETRWRLGRRDVRHRLRELSPDDTDRSSLIRVLRRPKDRWHYSLLEPRWDEDENDWDIMGSMSPGTAKVAEKKHLKGLHSGLSRSDPIPIAWYKEEGQYESLELDRRPNPPANTPKIIASPFGSTRTRVFDASGRRHTIGVLNRYRISEKQIVRKRTGRPYTPRQTAFRDLLEALGFNWINEQPDHVRDLTFGGPDAFTNLWPLDATVNTRGAAFSSHYRIRYKREINGEWEPKWTNLNSLPGKYFIIMRINGQLPPSSLMPDGRGRNK